MINTGKHRLVLTEAELDTNVLQCQENNMFTYNCAYGTACLLSTFNSHYGSFTKSNCEYVGREVLDHGKTYRLCLKRE